MSISAVNNNRYSNYSAYGKIASGKALTSAADGAAELAISQRENAQITGYTVGEQNAAMGSDMLNVSDGALASITDNLQRMRELAIQAKNGILSNSDRSNIQLEVDQIKQGIANIADTTDFNTQKLLDGSNTDWNLVTDGKPTEMTVTTASATLEKLGLQDFDVTKDFDLETIDNALEMVTSSRADGGAQTNSLTFTRNYNNIVAENTTAAVSRLEDLDMEKAISDLKKNELLDTYKTMMAKKQMEQQQNNSANLMRGLQNN